MEALKHRRILIVDDEETDRMLLSAYLQHHDCRLFHAHDGLEGIEKARALQPDLVLMDAQMPNCSGYDACKILSGDPRTSKIPIIFISGLTWPEQRVQGLLAGAVDYINKPFDFNEVKLRIAIHLRHRTQTAHEPDSPTDALARPRTLHNILFHSARTHLLKSLTTVPTMKELEKLTGTNSKHLNNAFKACAGVTVYEYLREERMKASRTLLQQTRLSVQDISHQVGFTSSANFSTAFKERFGLTPREFRLGQH